MHKEKEKTEAPKCTPEEHKREDGRNCSTKTVETQAKRKKPRTQQKSNRQRQYEKSREKVGGATTDRREEEESPIERTGKRNRSTEG